MLLEFFIFIFRTAFTEERVFFGWLVAEKSIVQFLAGPDAERDGSKRFQRFQTLLSIPLDGGFMKTFRTVMFRIGCINFALREKLMTGVTFTILRAAAVRADFQRTSFYGKVLNLVFGNQFFAGITTFAMEFRTFRAINMSVPMTGGFRRLPFTAVFAENIFPV